ncbi:class I SAM-dependent methyltransferase [Shewanella benthica]|uniref:Putative S-adenosyl-L-methionine-dependent methyltransferase n=1 Tax=Shewanella benthica KT99 TaxID=314608 RepID=A9DP16_9GAMM|nr:class I SAM-dependent methyltransferase [Shewanella benthica]EDP98652.1 putative S-adenosyl-L-methionine-dependent methyltransferase [Shewanella benthica KT99]
MNNHWSEYWEQGHLTSFGDSFTDNYTGVLKNVWKPIFEGLPNDYKFLDLATGNGALPLLASDYLREKSIRGEGVGVDLAKISTDLSTVNIADNITISLNSEVDCTSLPFNESEFDLVVSQFGIEYADLEIAIPEALRVLKVDGKLSFVMHHEHSMVITRNRKIHVLINNQQVDVFFDAIIKLIEKMGPINTKHDFIRVKSEQACKRLRQELQLSIDALVKADEEALQDSELLTYLSTLFNQGIFWSVDKKRDYIEFAKLQILTLRNRLEELIFAAKTQQNIAQILVSISNLGAYLDSVKTLYSENDEIIGWHIVVTKIHNSSECS